MLETFSDRKPILPCRGARRSTFTEQQDYWQEQGRHALNFQQACKQLAMKLMCQLSTAEMRELMDALGNQAEQTWQSSHSRSGAESSSEIPQLRQERENVHGSNLETEMKDDQIPQLRGMLEAEMKKAAMLFASGQKNLQISQHLDRVAQLQHHPGDTQFARGEGYI